MIALTSRNNKKKGKKQRLVIPFRIVNDQEKQRRKRKFHKVPNPILKMEHEITTGKEQRQIDGEKERTDDLHRPICGGNGRVLE